MNCRAEKVWKSIMDSYKELGYGLIPVQFDMTAIPIIAAYGADLEARAEKAGVDNRRLQEQVKYLGWILDKWDELPNDVKQDPELEGLKAFIEGVDTNDI